MHQKEFKNKPLAFVCVTNDLLTDQRVHKTSDFLCRKGFDVLLIGRRLKTSLPINDRTYKTHRMKLWFTKGAFFYAEYNIRLFFFLIRQPKGLIVANDLDTLLASFWAKKLKHKGLVYDSHEYYTEVPELENRPFVKAVWTKIEASIFPKLNTIITVNNSIAELYRKKYGKELFVVRNIPEKKEQIIPIAKTSLNLPEDKKIIILQGAGLNIHRGCEEAVLAMQYVENAVLVIIGSGDVIHILHQMVKALKIENRVMFFPRMPYQQMMQYTVNADLGLTLDKANNINYLYSLPNKLFDYIQARIPILSSNLVEIERIITQYNIGDFVQEHNPVMIGQKINAILNNSPQLLLWKNNLALAAQELNWENEQVILEQVYANYIL